MKIVPAPSTYFFQHQRRQQLTVSTQQLPQTPITHHTALIPSVAFTCGIPGAARHAVQQQLPEQAAATMGQQLQAAAALRPVSRPKYAAYILLAMFVQVSRSRLAHVHGIADAPPIAAAHRIPAKRCRSTGASMGCAAASCRRRPPSPFPRSSCQWCFRPWHGQG